MEYAQRWALIGTNVGVAQRLSSNSSGRSGGGSAFFFVNTGLKTVLTGLLTVSLLVLGQVLGLLRVVTDCGKIQKRKLNWHVAVTLMIMPPKKNELEKMKQPKRVTLQDIADVAGVKKMVVSNALNNTRSVAPATREKVLRIAKEMNYVPNFAARALTTGRTGIIAVLCGPVSEPFYGNMVHFLEGHIHAAGFNLVLMRTPQEVKELVTATGRISADGAIAVDMLGLVREFIAASNMPCVSIATVKQESVDRIIADLGVGVREAVELMIKAGRKRIAYLATSDNMAREIEVRAGSYMATMRDAGRVPEMINLGQDDFDRDVVEALFKAYVKEHGCPDGLICKNDETAMCAFRVFKALGFVVPSDVLLVGCDGHPHMKDFDPPLSTIVQPMKQMCETAWDFLQKRIAEPDSPYREAIFECKLVVRESLGTPAPTENAQ